MSLPKISIITVVLNGEIHLERCINSILGQQYPDLEYIVIDGGSTDGTLSILARYQDRINKLVSEKDRGISDAFNKGLLLATGEIIGIINADDWLESNALREVAAGIEGNSEIFYGHILQWFGNKATEASANHLLLKKRMTINHPAVFVRKKVYDQIGYFNENYKVAMDYEWLLRCINEKIVFQYTEKVLVNMKMEGISMRHWKAGLKDVKIAKDSILGGSFNSTFYFYYQVFATYLSLSLHNSKFEGLLRLYQLYFSPVKKRELISISKTK